jgi:Tfp pilus assembly protein PilV
MNARSRIEAAGGFVLLEAMLAVAIFAITVFSIGACIQNCLKAEVLKEEDARGRRILENRMMEIEAGYETVGEKKPPEEIKAYPGMTLTTASTPLKAKNEKKEDITGIYDVKLTLSWPSGTKTQEKSIEFYVYPRQR